MPKEMVVVVVVGMAEVVAEMVEAAAAVDDQVVEVAAEVGLEGGADPAEAVPVVEGVAPVVGTEKVVLEAVSAGETRS